MPRLMWLLLGLLVFFFPWTVAQSAIVNSGLVSFDVLIPSNPSAPGVNVFNIANFTGDPSNGGFALPPDFPVFDQLIFLNSSLTLMNGGLPMVIPLGDLGPGALNVTDAVQFSNTTQFSSAIFAATLSHTNFQLADGTIFTAAGPKIRAKLIPSSGSFLLAGAEYAVVTVSDVPEPSTLLVCATALAAIIVIHARKQSS